MARICIFGASITWGAFDTELGGWADRIKLSMLQRTPDYHLVHNLGVSADTTKGLLARFESESLVRIRKNEKNIAILSIGINDAITYNGETSRETEVADFKSTIHTIQNEMLQLFDEVICVGLTPVLESKTQPFASSVENVYYFNHNIKELDNILKAVSDENKIPFVSVYDDISEDMLQIDGLHPNAEGHKLIHDAVLPVLESVL